MEQRVILYFGQRYQKTKPIIDKNIMTEILFKKEYFSVKVRKHIIVAKKRFMLNTLLRNSFIFLIYFIWPITVKTVSQTSADQRIGF